MTGNKCGFLLVEEQMKRKTFFSHTTWSLGSGVRGCLGHMVCARYSFVCCHLPLPDLPRPPAVLSVFQVHLNIC